MGFDFQSLLTQDKLAKKKLERILKELTFHSNRNALAGFPLEFIDEYSNGDKDTLVLILQCDKTTSEDIASYLSTTSDERRKSSLKSLGKDQKIGQLVGNGDLKQRRASLQTTRRKHFQNWRSQSLDLDKLRHGKENWFKIKGIFEKGFSQSDKRKQSYSNKQNVDCETEEITNKSNQNKENEISNEKVNGVGTEEFVVYQIIEDISKSKCETVLNEKQQNNVIPDCDVLLNQNKNETPKEATIDRNCSSPSTLEQINENTNREILDFTHEVETDVIDVSQADRY